MKEIYEVVKFTRQPDGIIKVEGLGFNTSRDNARTCRKEFNKTARSGSYYITLKIPVDRICRARKARSKKSEGV